jgi:midasin
MSLLDGLGSLSQLSTFSPESLRKLKLEAMSKVHELAPLSDISHPALRTLAYNHSFLQLGPFAIQRGPREPFTQSFNFQTPTTAENAMRVLRACQVVKPILLEGVLGLESQVWYPPSQMLLDILCVGLICQIKRISLIFLDLTFR